MSFLRQYRAVFLVVTAVLALFVATPVIQQYLEAPETEKLTEFSVLGPYHNASYPYNIGSGQVIGLYLTVSNHLDASAYYRIEVKVRSQADSAPDSFSHTPSSLPSVGELTCVVADEQTLELPANVSFNYQEVSGQIYLNSITLNGNTLKTSVTIPWDGQKYAYLGNLIFELYLYNESTGSFQYHQRYLSLWFKFN